MQRAAGVGDEDEETRGERKGAEADERRVYRVVDVTALRARGDAEDGPLDEGT